MRKIARGFGYLVLVGLVVVSMGYRFSNPTLTETQLFLAFLPGIGLGLFIVTLLLVTEQKH